MDSFDTIYMIGAHKLAVSYWHKLEKAKANRKISYKHLFLISDEKEPYAIKSIPKESLIVQKASEFILNFADNSQTTNNDILIPDHTAKHILLQSFLSFAQKLYPQKNIKLAPFQNSLKIPFLYKSDNDALWAMSYATWTCPADCGEPKVCPHTQDDRTWDFNKTLSAIFKELEKQNTSCHRFFCKNLYEEISFLYLKDIQAEFEKFKKRFDDNAYKDCVVATHSHCHGILGKFSMK